MKKMSEKEMATHLGRVNERRKIIESSIAAVVQGFQPAFFVYGPPGLGKTHMLSTLLDAMAGKGWRHHTAHSTPKALMLTLAEDPAAIHVYEDCERMLKTELCASILRAACGAPGDRERWVTYETAHETLRVKVTGGIVIATNQNLAKTNGPLQGVASRFRPMLWSMTLDERIATIFKMAEGGWSRGNVRVSPSECCKVALALVDMVQDTRLSIDLDLRLFAEHALPAYAHCKTTSDADRWQDILLAKLTGSISTVVEAREEKARRLKTLALMLDRTHKTTKDKVQAWRDATQLGQAIFYRHLRDARADEKALQK